MSDFSNLPPTLIIPFPSRQVFKLLILLLILTFSKCIVKMVELKYLINEELKQLKMKNKENVKISSKISSLNTCLDGNGIIRVGGRLEKSDINNDCKHSKGCHISKLIILWCHQKTRHSGRGMTLNEVRISGFWIVNANSVIRSLIYHCVT